MITPIVLERPEHPVSRSDIDPDALKVLYRLKRHGHIVYLVGGCVRDLLLGKRAKDFDISTSARPGKVKALFSNCRIIGRRFRLAHIFFKGNKIIEVATFRKQAECTEESVSNDDLLIRQDNTFGTPEEDAYRRDFTINGLFYDIKDFSLIDYVGGLKDIELRLVRAIGDPEIRFREDPIRMIRAIKFAARLDLQIEDATYQAILICREELLKSPKSRVLEEIYRLLDMGAAEKSFALMKKTGLLEVLMPEIAAALDLLPQTEIRWAYLRQLDQHQQAGHPVTHALAWGTLVYPIISKYMETLTPQDMDKRMLEPIAAACAQLQVSRKDRALLKQILFAQRRLKPAKRKRRFSRGRLMAQEGFPDALRLFKFYVDITGEYQDAGNEWLQVFEQYRADQKNMPVVKTRPPRRRRGRRTARAPQAQTGTRP